MITTQLPCEEGVVRATAATAVCTKRAAPWILAATVIASSMAFINGTVVNVAQAALLLVGGAAGDRYGRRLVFLLGVFLFAAASIWCGLAGTAGEIIVARAV